MRELVFEINGERSHLQVETQNGGYQIVIDERTYQVTVQRYSDGQLDLLIDGQPQRFYLANSADNLEQRLLWHQGQIWRLNAVDTRSRRKTTKHEHSDAMLSATMPGVVRAMLVKVGDPVAAGDPLVVLEAMKMEIRVSAPHAGQVSKVYCQFGDVVNRGQELIEIERLGD